MYDSIVIGSGPAGYTAGIYLSRAGQKNMLISGYVPGGQLTSTTTVENFPGFPEGTQGTELVLSMKEQAEKFGTEIKEGYVKNISNDSSPFTVELESGERFETKTVIIATGSSARKLGIDGEAENIGRGVNICATCDGFFYRGKEVAIIGGGDVAMEEAIYLTKFASKVTIINRREELRASEIMAERARSNPKIEWKLAYSPVRYLSDASGITGLEIKNNKTGEVESFKTDGVFLAIGHKPNSGFLNGKLELDEKGYIITGAKNSRTSIDGIFAAGDVQDPRYQQAVTSAGSGAAAAMDAQDYISSL